MIESRRELVEMLIHLYREEKFDEEFLRSLLGPKIIMSHLYITEDEYELITGERYFEA